MKGSNLVKLNVGGQKFTTTYETLSKSQVLTAKHRNTTAGVENVVIYLDKDPKIFAYVLNIMRGDLLFQDVPFKHKKHVYALMDYLLVAAVTAESFYCPDSAAPTRSIFASESGTRNYRFYLEPGDAVRQLFIRVDQVFKDMYVDITVKCQGKTVLSVVERPTEHGFGVPLVMNILQLCTVDVDVRALSSAPGKTGWMLGSTIGAVELLLLQ